MKKGAKVVKKAKNVTPAPPVTGETVTDWVETVNKEAEIMDFFDPDPDDLSDEDFEAIVQVARRDRARFDKDN